MSEAMNYKLPPLPTFEEWCRIICPSEPGTQIASVENFVKAYAIAAIEAQGVPDVVVLQIDAAVTKAQKVLSDWNDWYGMHGVNAPIPPGGIVKTQELLAVAKSLLASAPPAPRASVVQQEPVAWMWKNTKTDAEGVYLEDPATIGIELNHPAYQWTLLYTHPAQQAKPQP